MRYLVVVFCMMISLMGPALAVDPEERLMDAALEERARTVSKQLRCVVCDNQSIDDSDADLAKELRVIVRERLTAGDTDQQVLDFVSDRYGDYVLLKPKMKGRTLILWAFPFLAMSGAIALAVMYIKGQRETPPTALDAQEEIELKKILEGHNGYAPAQNAGEGNKRDA